MYIYKYQLIRAKIEGIAVKNSALFRNGYCKILTAANHLILLKDDNYETNTT